MKSLMEKDTEFCSSTSTTAAAGLFKESETVQGGCRALPSISAHCYCRLTQKYEKNFTKFVSKSHVLLARRPVCVIVESRPSALSA